MNEPFQLKIIDKFSGVFKKLGYDYEMLLEKYLKSNLLWIREMFQL